MRRLIEWLDIGPALSGAAYVATGVLCLGAVSGVLLTSLMSSSDVALTAAVKPALASADKAEPASILVPAVFRAADMNAALLQNAVTAPSIRIKLSDLQRERKCLTESIYYEARGETDIGQLAIAEVVLNRVLSGRYPDSICGVVFQGQKTNQCQFSFACIVDMDKPRDPVAWRKAQRLAHYVLSGDVRTSIVGTATFYHAVYVSPQWAPSMVEVAKIGHHIFYKQRQAAATAVAATPDPQS